MTAQRWVHEPLAGNFVRHRSLAAKAYKLPLGAIVRLCARCSKPVHESELSYVYEKHAWAEVHRVCRRPPSSVN